MSFSCLADGGRAPVTGRQAILRKRLGGQGSAAAFGNAAVGGGLARHGGPAAGFDELLLPVAVGDGLEFGQFRCCVRCRVETVDADGGGEFAPSRIARSHRQGSRRAARHPTAPVEPDDDGGDHRDEARPYENSFAGLVVVETLDDRNLAAALRGQWNIPSWMLRVRFRPRRPSGSGTALSIPSRHTAVDGCRFFHEHVGDHCLGGIRNDNPAFGFEFAFGATDDDAVVEWVELHGSLSAAGA